MARNIFPIWAAPIASTNFNVATALLGGFISLFGLVSYLLKEHFYLSEARKSISVLSSLFFSWLCPSPLPSPIAKHNSGYDGEEQHIEPKDSNSS